MNVRALALLSMLLALPALADEAQAPAAEPSSGPSCPEKSPCLKSEKISLWPKLRLRTGYGFVQPDDKVLFVGHNDGFFIDQARLGVEGTYLDRFFVKLTFELASLAFGQTPNDPVAPLLAAARDAYVVWAPSDFFQIAVGQAYMPFVLEGLISRAEMAFTRRSVASDGVEAGQGFYEEGLSPDRQLGVVLGAASAPLGPVRLEYRAAVTNGNGKNVLGNDNKLPAASLRLGAGYESFVSAAVGLLYNPRTVGDLPVLYNETDLAVAGDLRIQAFGIDVLAQAIFRQTSFDTVFPDVSAPGRTEQAFGVTSWIVLDRPFGLPTFGLKPGYRFSYYDPRSTFPEDQLMEHTFGLRYEPPTSLPMAFIFDVTLLFESAEGDAGLRESARNLDNHRAVALVQFDL